MCFGCEQKCETCSWTNGTVDEMCPSCSDETDWGGHLTSLEEIRDWARSFRAAGIAPSGDYGPIKIGDNNYYNLLRDPEVQAILKYSFPDDSSSEKGLMLYGVHVIP